MKSRLYVLSAALLGSALAAPAAFAGTPTCAQLADPAWGLVGNPLYSSVSVVLVPAAGVNQAYCKIELKDNSLSGPADGYMVGQTSNIGIRVGLPLNAADGGTGGVQGAWNGKVESLGNGGFAGALVAVTAPVNAGYAGTSSDTGHSGGSPSFGLNPDGTTNYGFITDYGWRAERRANQVGRSLAKVYYGSTPTRVYWNGCSDGGREGHEMAQRFGGEFDGLMTLSPAISWDRWGMSAGWNNYVANTELGANNIASAKYTETNNRSIAFCDGIDGIVDGNVQDTRKCHYDAAMNICGAPTANTDPTKCLTAAEAQVINKTRDGPRDAAGHKVWFGWEWGSTAGNSTTPSTFGAGINAYWVHHNAAFDWHTISEQQFIHEMNVLTNLFAPNYIGSDNPVLNALKNHGGKMIAAYGDFDQVIPPRTIFPYLRRVLQQQGSMAAFQSFYRFYWYPNATHCGGAGMDQTAMFNAVVNWAENGLAPDYFVAQVNPTRTRKVCMYPNVSVYNGSGSTDDQANFSCQVNADDDPTLINADIVVKTGHAVEF